VTTHGGARGQATPTVAVVGGGLAGITAALDLADAGLSVRLHEQRQHLGGATWSFRRKGLRLDNGQHVFLRCCTAYRAFLDRIGASGDVVLQDRLSIPVFGAASPEGAAPVLLSRAPLPAPLHLGPTLLRYGHLSARDRLGVGPAVLALRHLDRERPELDDQTFGDWLAAHGQSADAIARLWDLITVPTVNLPAREASLATAAMVFQVGLLTDASAADIGWSRVPLGVLHGERASTALEQAGVEVVLGAGVEAIDERGVTVDGRHEEADGVVVAVPHERAQQLVPGRARRDTTDWSALGRSPIVTVHVVYDRRVTDLAMAAVLGEPNLWLFDRTDGSGLDPAAGQYLAVTVSAAESWIGRRPSDLVAEVTATLARRFPAAASAAVVDAVVSREHAATFRATPGSARLRPSADTAWRRLVLAGAWTDTGWPATMEGAVRSGHRAALVLRQALDGRSSSPLEPAPAAPSVRRNAGAWNPHAQEVPA
jgi:squalene-associated FAD-dependent desaturase